MPDGMRKQRGRRCLSWLGFAVIAMVALFAISASNLIGDISWNAAVANAAAIDTATDNEARVWLSWDIDNVITAVKPGYLGFDSDQGSAKLVLYLSAESAAPIDSLGLNLRWATREAGGNLVFSGIRAAGDSFDLITGAKPMEDGVYRPLDSWFGSPGSMAAAQEQTADGTYLYRFEIGMTLEQAQSLQILASSIVIRNGAGKYQRPGNVSASVGDGWMIEMPPLVTEVRGLLNHKALKSRVVVNGDDLDRLVRLAVIDGDGTKVFPTTMIANSRESMVLKFTTKAAKMGFCGLEIGGPNGWTTVLEEAIEAKTLKMLQPFDEAVEVNTKGAE